MLKKTQKKLSATRDLAFIALAVALLVICSFIAIPTPAGHITLQLFAVLLIASIFDIKKSFVSVSLYVTMGLIGLPIFAGFRGGLGVLFDTSGGFLASFIIISLLLPSARYIFGNSRIAILISSIICILITYVVAALWLCFITAGGLSAKNFGFYLTLSSLPYIFPDLAKLVLALCIAPRVRKFIDFSTNKKVSS